MTDIDWFWLAVGGLPPFSVKEALWSVDALTTAGFKVTSYQMVDGGRKVRFARERFEQDVANGDHCYFNLKGGIDGWCEAGLGISRVRKPLRPQELKALLALSNAAILRGPSMVSLELGGDRGSCRTHYDGNYLQTSHSGLTGLSTRTYYGPHYVSLFTRELLLSTPAASVEEFEGGGIQIDLVEDFVNATQDEVYDAWLRCMRHLEPAGVFSVVKSYPRPGMKDRKELVPGPNYVPAPSTRRKLLRPDGPHAEAFSRLLASEKDGPASGLDITGADFSFRSLNDVQTEFLTASELNARGSSWRGAFFDSPALGAANFEIATLDESRMIDPFLEGANFTDASLRHVVWSSPLANDATFDGADLTGANLDGGAFSGSTFKGAKLAGASLLECSFRGCDLSGADLRAANLQGADFHEANLTDALFDEGERPG